jgi:hypothetical protein
MTSWKAADTCFTIFSCTYRVNTAKRVDIW